MAYNALREAVKGYGRRIDETEIRATMWRASFFITLAALLISSATNVYLAIKSDIRPYVVRMKDTEIIKVSPLEQLSTPTTYEIKAELIKVIEAGRAVVGDGDYQRKLLDTVYSHIKVGSPAFNTLNQWYATNNPYDRGKSIRVIPQNTNVNAVGGKTFLIEWEEQHKQKEGAVYDTKNYRATVIIERDSISKEEEIYRNPFGLFIEEIDWAEFHGGNNG